MPTRIFSSKDGLRAVDLVHCGIDHLAAAELLFKSGPHLFDSAGYLAHLGVEMLLKAWLLELDGSFEGVHRLSLLHTALVDTGATQPLGSGHLKTLKKLDGYASLRYPNLVNPTEVGQDDWRSIELLVGEVCRSMPASIDDALAKVNTDNSLVRKAGRVLMKKKRNGS